MSLRSSGPVVGVCLCIAMLAASCGDDDRPIPGGDSGVAMDAGPGAMDAGPGAMDAGPGATDAGASLRDSSVTYNDAGCLTFASASVICGFSSDDRICALSVMCGTSSDMGQCGINCEMGTTVRCYGPDDVACLESATTCTALAACGWIL